MLALVAPPSLAACYLIESHLNEHTSRHRGRRYKRQLAYVDWVQASVGAKESLLCQSS
jgi:hypothetical protein